MNKFKIGDIVIIKPEHEQKIAEPYQHFYREGVVVEGAGVSFITVRNGCRVDPLWFDLKISTCKMLNERNKYDC